MERNLFDYTGAINNIGALVAIGLPCRASHILGLALKEIKKEKIEDAEHGYQAVLNRIMAESRQALALLQLRLDNEFLVDSNPHPTPLVIDSSGLPIHLTPRLAAAPDADPRSLE